MQFVGDKQWQAHFVLNYVTCVINGINYWWDVVTVEPDQGSFFDKPGDDGHGHACQPLARVRWDVLKDARHLVQ